MVKHCTHEWCWRTSDQYTIVKWYCPKHYQQARARWEIGSTDACLMDWCYKISFTAWYCGPHYQELRRLWEVWKCKECLEPWCKKNAVTIWYCNSHYQVAFRRWATSYMRSLHWSEYERAAQEMFLKNANWKNIPERKKDDLTLDERISISTQRCYYCNALYSSYKELEKMCIMYNWIDRVDSSQHYHALNCVPCCRNCNAGKNNADLPEFLCRVKSIYENLALWESSFLSTY